MPPIDKITINHSDWIDSRSGHNYDETSQVIYMVYLYFNILYFLFFYFFIHPIYNNIKLIFF